MAGQSTTSLKLESEMKDRIQRLALTRRRSSHWILREAVEQYVVREEKREQFRQETLAAWAHYQATGLHVTEREANLWLEKLAAGEDAAIPECHV